LKDPDYTHKHGGFVGKKTKLM